MTDDRVTSLRERLAKLDQDQATYVLARLEREREARRTLWCCKYPRCSGKAHRDAPAPHARADQRWPFAKDDGLWGCLWMAGRGWGKTRSVAEAVREAVTEHGYKSIGLISRTAGDARDIVVEGESGILNVFPSWDKPEYLASKAQVVFPSQGAVAYMLSSEKPDAIRGKQFDLVIFDEFATYYHADAVLSNALFALRLKTGAFGPRALFATTPKNTAAVRQLVKRKGLKIVRGRTADNLANLAPTFKDSVMAQYEGTRTGRQELDGELLLDVEGALLKAHHFDWEGFRPETPPEELNLKKVVVSVDPAVTANKSSDCTGLTVVGQGTDERFYVLHTEAVRESPKEAMQRAIRLYHHYGANALIGEVNNGGDYIGTVIGQLDPTVVYRKVRASKGKYARAEPVAMLYEQHRVSHAGHPSMFAKLEGLWTSWTPDEDESPDELDAAVWGLTWLAFKKYHVDDAPPVALRG